MIRVVGKRVLMAGVVSVVCMGGAAAAVADTVHFEAEAARMEYPYPSGGTITSPLMIYDDAGASGGSYVMVAPGNNSSTATATTAPDSDTEGVAKYVFKVAQTGTYRIWGRVKNPTVEDDSFWVRMSIVLDPSVEPAPAPIVTPWVKWNGDAMPPGSAYHWVMVQQDRTTSPSTFDLTAGALNELQIAYREDGTRLDALYITSDTAFNPSAALNGPPLQPIMHRFARGGGSTRISWSAVPGATSYTVEKASRDCSWSEAAQCCVPETPYAVIATGITGHTFTEVGGGGKYRVTAVAPTGSSYHPPSVGPDSCYPSDPSEELFADSSPFNWRTQIYAAPSVTSPIQSFSSYPYGAGAPAGTNSTSAAPAHGRIRLDFQLAATATMRMWANINAPNTSQDSFWVRWDNGAWINWNNLYWSCSTLYDSNNNGSIVRKTLGPGSHRIEWAYREGGARLTDQIIIREDEPGLSENQCSD